MTDSQKKAHYNKSFYWLTPLDFFGKSFDFQFPGGRNKHKTIMGAIVSLVLILMLLFYLCLRTTILIFRSDTDYLAYESEIYFRTEFFTSEDGFNVAFALTEYDNVEEPIEDPDYGVLKAYHYGWKQDTREIFQTPVSTEPCTQDDLHLNEEVSGQSSSIFPIGELYIGDVRRYWEKFKCVREDIQI